MRSLSHELMKQSTLPRIRYVATLLLLSSLDSRLWTAQSRARRCRGYAAVDAVWRQMRRLIVHPEAAPFVVDLAEVFGIDHQLFHANHGIAGILIDEAACARDEENCPGCQDQHSSPHDPDS